MDPVRKSTLARKRRWRVRAHIFGTADRPRLSVHFSNRHICAQCIDDRRAVTLASSSSLAPDSREGGGILRANMNGAKEMGAKLAAKALAAGIGRVVLDRGPRRYHGCVKAFSDAARAAGLEF